MNTTVAIVEFADSAMPTRRKRSAESAASKKFRFGSGIRFRLFGFADGAKVRHDPILFIEYSGGHQRGIAPTQEKTIVRFINQCRVGIKEFKISFLVTSLC
jgi:hypothetical protein